MSKCIGGSWDGHYLSGRPYHLRKLVVFERTRQEVNDFSVSETYVREEAAGEWIFVREGTSSEADGPWYFTED